MSVKLKLAMLAFCCGVLGMRGSLVAQQYDDFVESVWGACDTSTVSIDEEGQSGVVFDGNLAYQGSCQLNEIPEYAPRAICSDYCGQVGCYGSDYDDYTDENVLTCTCSLCTY